MFANIPARFLPPERSLPQLTFGAPWLHYAHSRSRLNATEELLDTVIARLGADRPAIHEVATARTWSYGEFQEAVNQLGNALLGLGLKPGERVFLRLPDCPEMAIAQLAVWKVGGVIVPSSVLERSREITFMINDTEAALAIVGSDHAAELETARSGCSTLREVVSVPGPGADGFANLLGRQSSTLEAYPNAPLDASGIYYTGGTTGHPKGCLHTHIAEVALADLTLLTRAAGPDDVFFTHAPIGHAFGNGEKINFPFRAGAAVIYADRPTPVEMFDFSERFGATVLAGAATMYRMMLRQTPDPMVAFPNLRFRSALSSGEILDRPTQDRWEEIFGFPLRNVVGMTPMRHIFLDANVLGVKRAPGLSVGTPLPGYEARLVDAETGEPAAPGAAGRLAMRGPTGITYWCNLHPFIRERAERDVQGGWSLLDDAYERDEEGWLWFSSRLDDMIVTGGRQVAAPEVEAVLAEHQAVAECAVIGVADSLRGQVVRAVVVLRDGFTADAKMVEVLQEHAKRLMAPYKYPRQIEFRRELPKDHVGKLQRRRLREEALAAQDSKSD